MGLDLKSTNGKLIVGGAIVLIVVLLLWPKFRGSSDKYEDDYLETEMFDDDEDSEDEYEAYADQWQFADEDFQGETPEEEDFGAYGPMDDTFGTLAPLAAAQRAIASSRPDLPGVNIATDLLPKPALSQTDFAEFAPKALGAQNFVDATSFVGVNTQGSALKNANYQLRADVPIPRVDVGPWSNSTIEAGDLSRKPLE